MLKQFLYKVLLEKIGDKKECSIDNIVEEIDIDKRRLVDELKKLNGILVDKNKVILKDKLTFTISLMKNGVSLETILLNLGWRDMEDIVGEILKKHGYNIVKNFRFKYDDKRFEIDLLAEKLDERLIIECKKWRHLTPSMAVKIVEKHLLKAKYYIEYIGGPRLDNKNIKYNIPIIVTSFEAPMKIYNGVPIISLHRFNNFLLEYKLYMNLLNII